MSDQTIKKSERTSVNKPKVYQPLASKKTHKAEQNVSSANSIERKAEEVKIFLSRNPIPQEFLKKR